MPSGTPEDYAAAREAEFEGVELRNPGRGENNLHFTVSEICREAAELAAFRAEHVELEAELAARAALIEAKRRASAPFKNLAQKIGDKAMGAFEAIGTPYVYIYERSRAYPPIPWTFPF